jgi:hypothetical protein
MALSISSETSVKVDVPMWAIAHIGKRVRLIQMLDEYGDGTFVFSVGSFGILDSITSEKQALVVFDDDPIKAWVDVPFQQLIAVDLEPDSFSKIPGRAGEIALSWSLGNDVKKRLSRPTFYRYRRQLLQHGIDISLPVSRSMNPQ